ncbi:MAG: hypothetical protein J1E81_05145 [Eubacterium sp.]|nr:hypothetical protein [Eubacterium sp.]
MKKKLLLFLLTCIFIISVPFSALAEDYGTEYPAYIPYSGGAYIEVQSSLGRGSLVFQDTYKTGYFGFSGSGYNLFNISNSTLTGRLIMQNGTTYQARFSSFNTLQYYYESGMTREWRDVTTSKIYNTNCEFLDNTTNDRGNIIDIFYGDSFNYSVVAFLAFILIVLIIIAIKKG